MSLFLVKPGSTQVKRYTSVHEWAKLCEQPIFTRLRYYKEPLPKPARGVAWFGVHQKSACCRRPKVGEDCLVDEYVLDDSGEPVVYDGKRSSPSVYYADQEILEERMKSQPLNRTYTTLESMKSLSSMVDK